MTVAVSPAVIESPCVLVCVVDGKTGLCFGCKRTLAEIGRWSRMTPQERRAVMDALPARPEPQAAAGQPPSG